MTMSLFWIVMLLLAVALPPLPFIGIALYWRRRALAAERAYERLHGFDGL